MFGDVPLVGGPLDGGTTSEADFNGRTFAIAAYLTPRSRCIGTVHYVPDLVSVNPNRWEARYLKTVDCQGPHS